MDGRIARFSVDLADPLRTADGTIEERTGFLVRLARTDSSSGCADPSSGRADHVGIGEATPLPGWTESLEECHAALTGALETLGERGPDAALDVAADAPAARHGLSLALADLRAREATESLAERLVRRDGDERDPAEEVPLNATVGAGDAETTAAGAADAVDRGFECVKVKVGAGSTAADRERLRAARVAVGADVALRADANGAWSPDAAADAARWLGDCDVDYVEQPLAADELCALGDLDLGGVDVALDESLAVAGPDAVLDADAADVLVLKPMVLGGPRRTVAVAERARSTGLRVVITTTIDAVVARTAAVHVAAALAPLPHCGLATGDRLVADLGEDPVGFDGGVASVPDGPGTGIEAALFDAVAAK